MSDVNGDIERQEKEMLAKAGLPTEKAELKGKLFVFICMLHQPFRHLLTGYIEDVRITITERKCECGGLLAPSKTLKLIVDIPGSPITTITWLQEQFWEAVEERAWDKDDLICKGSIKLVP